MILLHIIAKNEKQADEISNFLLKENFALDTFLTNGMVKTREDDELQSEAAILVTARTRALLFNKIDKAIHDQFATDPPIVYSVPIVNMDWDHASELETKVKV